MIDIRPMTAGDWPTVEAIFAERIATGTATLETEPPDYDSFDATTTPLSWSATLAAFERTTQLEGVWRDTILRERRSVN